MRILSPSLAPETHLSLHEDRLFSSDPTTRSISRELYASVARLPILSPHGHTDPAWFDHNQNFNNATALFLSPDHYLYRMLYASGLSLQSLGVTRNGEESRADPEQAWALFAQNYHLFLGTPSRMWMDHVFATVFEFDEVLSPASASNYFTKINEALASEAFRPRSLYERFNIELLATTEGAVDTLDHHRAIQNSGWQGRVISAYRPDSVVDPDHEHFKRDLIRLADLTGEDVANFAGYLRAHRQRRAFFKSMGATSTDHGHPSAQTANLGFDEAAALYATVTSGVFTPAEAELFRAQMLTEMARMSLDDGLVMQIHAGAYRNHNQVIFDTFGRDKGADVPSSTEFVRALKPLLDLFGNEPELSIILFTLDETTYARELAPLAGHYPALKLGPAWWFNDSPEGMLRFREQVTPIAGFYNTVGFNDDTRAFLSIPARHDMARRMDARYLASLVADHRLTLSQAHDLIRDLTYTLPKQAYRL